VTAPQVTAERRRGSASILFALWGFAFLSYLLRTNISVAQEYMARELHWSDLQVGYIFAAFLTGYTMFQVPAGALGDRFGARVVLAAAGISWALTTFLTGLIPGLLVAGASGALFATLVIRFLHGLEEAATYPVTMIAVSDWYPPRDHALISAVIFTGSTLGAAFAGPLVSQIMDRAGWRAPFYVTALLPLLLGWFWWRATTNKIHPVAQKCVTTTDSEWLAVFKQREILLLSLSYFLYCYAISIYVYWLFKYLVDVRHLSIVNSGWANALPWISATLMVPPVGEASRRLSARIGRLPGRRLVAVLCLLIAAGLIFVGAGAQNITVALAAIAICVGLLFSTESLYWSTAIDSTPGQAGAGSGLMNLAGNLGGVASTLAVPILAAHFGWFHALLSGSLFSILAAFCWFLLRVPRSRGAAIY
jgi:ACS family glucarate transporter-like MFS transporter